MTNGKGTFTNEIDFSDYDKQKDLTVMENRYDKYKDSGIAWIGVIPEHWEVRKGKNIFKKEERPVRDFDEIVTCFRNGEVTLRSNRRIDGFTNAVKEIGYQGVRKGDLVIHNMDAFAGAIGVSDSDGKSTPVYSICTPRNDTEANTYYYAYLLRSYALGGVIQSLAKGIRERSTDFRYKEFGELFYQQPPLAEQQAIADYLDRRCSEIDELIALQEEMITKLQSYKQSVITEAVTRGLDKNVPLKDSDIDWIGKIPEHWNCTAFKRLLLEPMQYGANEPAEECDYNNPRYIRITDIKEDRTLRDDTFKSLPLEKAKDYILSKGDLLFARSGATVGKTFLYNEDNAACFAGYLIKAKCNKKKLVPNFVFYYTLSNIYQNWKNSIFIQSTIQNIGADKYSSMPIIVPPLAEQQAIADYLDQRCSEIDELIALKQQKIEKLKEYKKSLIFECVTGKRKVS